MKSHFVSEELEKRKPIAVIHVDVDSLWAIEQDFGNLTEPRDLSIYTQAVPKFIELFKKYQIPATFFCVGRDALQSEQAEILRELVMQGHEVANHTMNHRHDFYRLNVDEKKDEIIRSNEVLQTVTESKILGFRSPGYFLDDITVQILQELGYSYDSSRFPTIILPLFALGRYLLSRGVRTHKRIGRLSDVWTNQKPYLIAPRQSNPKHAIDLLEMPISVTPTGRFPFHSTMVFTYGQWLFDLGVKQLLQHNYPLVYLFHAVDLLPKTDSIVAAKHPTLRIKFDDRLRLVDYVLDTIKNSFEIATSNDFAVSFISNYNTQSN